MNYCKNCGEPLEDGGKFCPNCGAVVEQAEPRTPQCVHCGRAMPGAAAFCPFCGRPQTAQESSSPAQPSNQYQTAQQELMTAVPKALAEDFTARELSFELTGFSEAALEQAVPIAGPIRTAFGGIKTLFANISRVRGSKKALISAIIVFVGWTAIGLWNRSGFGNDLSQTLSTITYAQGGTKGTAAQIAGGIFGKGVVMTAVLSLFSGGLIATLKGIGKLFGRGLAIGTMLAGLGTAVLFHQLMAGFTGFYGTAVAASGAVLSLQALSGRTGFLRSMAVSLTSQKAEKVRSANPVGVKSFLTGVTLGMVLSGAVSALLRIPWWIGGILLVIGILTQAVLGRKEAGA